MSYENSSKNLRTLPYGDRVTQDDIKVNPGEAWDKKDHVDQFNDLCGGKLGSIHSSGDRLYGYTFDR